MFKEQEFLGLADATMISEKTKKGQMYLSLPASIATDFYTANQSFYAQLFPNEDALLVSTFNGGESFKRPTVRFNKGKKSIEVGEELLPKTEVLSGGERTLYEVYRCVEEVLEYKVVLKRNKSYKRLKIALYNNPTPSEIKEMCEAYSGFNLSFAVYRRIDGILFKAVQPF